MGSCQVEFMKHARACRRLLHDDAETGDWTVIGERGYAVRRPAGRAAALTRRQ